MKRLLLILPLLLTFTITNAQQFKIGIIAGLGITDVAGADLIDNDNDFQKGGFIGGGFVNTKIGQTTQMQLEISFMQKGSQVPPDTLHMNNYYVLNLNYVDVSLMVRQPIHININRKMSDKYGLIFGLTYGNLVYYSFEVQGINYQLNLNSFDASAFIGFYYNFTPNFFFDMRYSNSFITAIKHDGSNSQWYPYYGSWNDGNNMAFELRLGYVFVGGSSAGDNSPSAAPGAPAQ